MHILSPETDNCPSWISGRERLTIENISRSISTKECCRLRWGSNLQPPGLQSYGASNWATEAGSGYTNMYPEYLNSFTPYDTKSINETLPLQEFWTVSSSLNHLDHTPEHLHQMTPAIYKKQSEVWVLLHLNKRWVYFFWSISCDGFSYFIHGKCVYL